MSIRLPQLVEGRDDLKRTQRVLNELLKQRANIGDGYFPCIEPIPQFYCVGQDATTGGLAIATSTGSVLACGVSVQASPVTGQSTWVRVCGRLNGAVSGRVANDLVYVGTNGELVFAAPAGYDQVIAKCINATDIFVCPQLPTI